MPYTKTIPFSFSLASLCLMMAASAPQLTAQEISVAQTSSTAVQTAKPIATETPTPTSAKAPDFSKEAIVYEKYLTRVREEADGAGVRTTKVRARILADAGVKDMAVLEFTYTASNQQMEIGRVCVTKPDGTVVVTPPYNIQDMPADVSREAPMYSDIHEKHVAVKGLGVGDVLEYEATLRTLKPDVPGHFWLEYSFEKNSIIENEELDLDLPADKVVRVASSDLQPTVTTANGRKLYHWASSNLTRPDPDAPPKSTKHWKPSVQVTTFASWEQVGAWYASLQKDPLTVTPAIQAKANALTKGLTTDEEKLRAIFAAVALHIHYIGLDFGIGRYQPHPADDVLSNEYGDCKDKSTLLIALLKAAGIEAWPVLISSSRPLDPDTPSLAQFDHVITVASVGGKLTWMDSTAEVAPVGVLYSSLRDKQALVVPATKPAFLERTSADLPFPQTTTFRLDGKLNDKGLLTAHIVQSSRGDGNTILRAVVRAIPQAKWKTFAEGFANRTGFSGDVTNPQFSPVEKVDEPFEMSYDYSREKFGEWDNRRISPPLPPVGMELMPGVKQIKPADDIDLGSPGEVQYSAVVQIPAGWLLYPPGPADVAEDWAEYHAKYVFEKGKFTSERRLLIKKNKVPLADWEKYLAFRQAIYADEIKAIALNNPNDVAQRYLNNFGDTGEPGWLAELAPKIQTLRDLAAILDADPPPSEQGAWTASEPARKAITEIEAKTLTLKLDEAQSLHSGVALANAWCLRGWLALNQHDLPTAENYLHAAWRLSRDKLTGYLLGQLLEAKGEKAAAAHQYELAHFASGSPRFELTQSFEERDRQIVDAYRKINGKDLPTSALNGGRYEGSLQALLDKDQDIRQMIRVTKLTGSGLFVLAFEAGKPAKAAFLGGDHGMERLVPQIEAYHFSPMLPTGSKARLLREVRMICTPYAGCDATVLSPASIEMPPTRMNIIHVAAPSQSNKDEKSVVIELQKQ